MSSIVLPLLVEGVVVIGVRSEEHGEAIVRGWYGLGARIPYRRLNPFKFC